MISIFIGIMPTNSYSIEPTESRWLFHALFDVGLVRTVKIWTHTYLTMVHD